MNQELRNFHLRQAAWWQKMSATEHHYSISHYQIERHRTYWQIQSAESSRRAMDHLRAAGVISDDN